MKYCRSHLRTHAKGSQVQLLHGAGVASLKIRAIERRKGCQQVWARKPGCGQNVVARGEQAIKIIQQDQAGFDRQGGAGELEAQRVDLLDELLVEVGLDCQGRFQVEAQAALGSELAAFRLPLQGVHLGFLTENFGQHQQQVYIELLLEGEHIEKQAVVELFDEVGV